MDECSDGSESTGDEVKLKMVTFYNYYTKSGVDVANRKDMVDTVAHNIRCWPMIFFRY